MTSAKNQEMCARAGGNLGGNKIRGEQERDQRYLLTCFIFNGTCRSTLYTTKKVFAFQIEEVCGWVAEKGVRHALHRIAVFSFNTIKAMEAM